jgi:predicted nucleic acid-binding protein
VERTETHRSSTLVDADVLLDVLTNDRSWADWSQAALDDAAYGGPLVVNPIVFAEASAGYTTAEEVDVLLPESAFAREAIPWAAAFLAGKAHAMYRRRGGARGATLPDFFIGAHAAVAGHRLLTRDPRRYRTYFPGLDIIAPS